MKVQRITIMRCVTSGSLKSTTATPAQAGNPVSRDQPNTGRTLVIMLFVRLTILRLLPAQMQSQLNTFNTALAVMFLWAVH
jgi:hypothetical protein